MTARHPKVDQCEMFFPTGQRSAAVYLREFADMLESNDGPHNAAIERVAIEMVSEKDSVTAEINIRLTLQQTAESKAFQ